jgi:2'-5' RNA ligase
MITTAERRSLSEQADKGHAVWLALFLPRIKEHPIRDFLPKDAHVTLGYYRSAETDALVEAACETARVVRNAYFAHSAIAAAITGLGYFWRKNEPTLVGLVNGITQMATDTKNWMSLHLKEQGAFVVPDTYDFIPHMTLNQAMRDHAAKLHDVSPVEIWFPTINVVCGDVRI